jgi:muramoyltetrapeptide carboxypeptidase
MDGSQDAPNLPELRVAGGRQDRHGGSGGVRVSGQNRKRFRLLPGDRVGVVAPGFAVKPALLRAGVARLQRMGFEVVLGDNCLARDGYLAGDDDLRASDLRKMIADPAVRAIWFARGGYGSSRLLDRLPWRLMKDDPKLLIGYSDLTALFSAAINRSGCICLYGPVVAELGDPASYHAPSLRNMLAGRPVEISFGQRRVMAGGKARGRLMGGNLSMIAHSCGTRFFPELRNSIFFLEEAGEETYRIDRMLGQLMRSGALAHVAGILLGGISTPARRRFPPDRRLNDVLREYLLPLGVPVLTGVRAGHVKGKLTLPLGGLAELDCAAGRLRFLP